MRKKIELILHNVTDEEIKEIMESIDSLQSEKIVTMRYYEQR